MTWTRRQAVGALGATAAAALAGGLAWRRGTPQAIGGACPELTGQRLRWIVPHAAGGGYDTESRLVAPHLAQRLGAEIVVENMPGAGGLLGANAIAAAPGDGRTLGIIGMPGLLAAELMDVPQVPEPAAFTVLGRISRSWHVWAAGTRRPIASLDDALSAGRSRDLVFAISEVASVNFLAIGVTAGLLGARVIMVPGFEGSRAAVLAAVRGDVDMVCFDFEVLRGPIESGELCPVLQVSRDPVADHPSLTGVPRLGALQTNPEADALIDLIGAGRVVVAPPARGGHGLECLAGALDQTLQHGEWRGASLRSVDIADAARARRAVQDAEDVLPVLAPRARMLLKAVRS